MKTTYKTLSLAALAVTLMAASPALADMDNANTSNESHQAIHQPMHGSGSSSMMGGETMKHGGYGSMMGNHHKMMSSMMHNGMANGNVDCPYATQANRDLSADDVRNIVEAQLVWRGNKRLKVGKVEASDDGTYLAEILTVDDSLVEQIIVDKNTGAMSRK